MDAAGVMAHRTSLFHDEKYFLAMTRGSYTICTVLWGVLSNIREFGGILHLPRSDGGWPTGGGGHNLHRIFTSIFFAKKN